jgi:hypothetical protein
MSIVPLLNTNHKKRSISKTHIDIISDRSSKTAKLIDIDSDSESSAKASLVSNVSTKRKLTDLTKDELDFCLEPIIQGLRNLKAEELLQLEIVESEGALLLDG